MKIAFVLFLFSMKALALEVGDTGPCAQVRDRQTDGSIVEHCVTTRNPGTRYVILDFFAATCIVCTQNLAKFTEFSRSVADTTTSRLVALDRNETITWDYLNSHQDLIQFPVAIDSARVVKEAYGVEGTPTVFLLDKSDRVLLKFDGLPEEEDWQEIRRIVSDLN